MSKTVKNLAEDAEDHEIFDINDFTTASDWERFVVHLEELINEWKLNSNSSDNKNLLNNSENDVNFETGEWQEKSENLQFADDVSFTITYFYLASKQGSTSSEKTSSHSITSQLPITKHVTYEESSAIDFDSLPLSSQSQLKKDKSIFNDPSLSNNLPNLPPKSMADLLNKSNDFLINYNNLTTTPMLAYWYGLCKFVLIAPTRSNRFIDNETRSCVILSAATTAVNNTGCLIPLFVQIQSPQREMYMGICEGSALKTHFNVLQFNYIPQQYSYLPGILEIFKSKLGNHLANTSLLISVSVRFTYSILENTFLDWQNNSIKQNQRTSLPESKSSTFDLEMIENKADDIYPDIKSLPFGSVQDCIDSMYLSCIWSNLSEDIIVDNESFTDLNPQYSNDWSITISNIMDKCDLQLTNLLLKYTDELKRTISVTQLLGGISSSSSTSQLFDTQNSNINEELKKSSLQKLANAKSAIRLDHVYNLSSNVMDLAANKMKALNLNDSSLPLDKGLMEYIMDYLFPDANLAKSKSIFNKVTIDESLYNDPNIKSFLKRLNLMKSSSIDNTGLLNKFVNCLAIVNQIGHTKAIAQLWRDFLLELRFRYENSILIPNLITSFNDPLKWEQQNSPDLSRSLLHQKIQMLNCCIKKKIDRQKYELNQSSNNQENNDEDEDEFYDCEESETNVQEDTFKPDGRSKKFGKLTLLNNPNEFIYVPITQEPTPMTEDMIEQHASVLVNLGSSDDAALLRAKIQSASLLSDMQSFKAANPNCVIEDFVRWYSPRDWVEYEEKIVDPITKEETVVKKYELSSRMKIPGNIWIEVWKSAKPVPVRRQKRLFDDTKEAENVFEWLQSLNIGQIVEQTLPILFYSAIFSSYQETHKLDIFAFVDSIFDVLVDKAIKISRNNDTKKYPELINYIKSIEQLTSFMKSLNSKFRSNKGLVNNSNDDEVKEFLKQILKSASSHLIYEVKIPNGAHSTIGKLITKLCYGTKKQDINRSKRNLNSNKYESVNEREQNEEDDESDDFENNDDLNNLTPFDKPFKREYILRSSCSRPAPYSRQSPQRMYCLLSDTEFRLAGAFTEDTMFF